MGVTIRFGRSEVDKRANGRTRQRYILKQRIKVPLNSNVSHLRKLKEKCE